MTMRLTNEYRDTQALLVVDDSSLLSDAGMSTSISAEILLPS